MATKNKKFDSNQSNEELNQILRKCKIIDDAEDFGALVNRVFSSITSIETKYGVSEVDMKDFERRVSERFINKQFVPSTTILTNAGRYKDKPLAACSVPPVGFRNDYSMVKHTIDMYHQKGMGTGFNFDDCDEPVELLSYLNNIAISGQDSGKEDRPVGNMCLISCDHPKIFEMIQCKNDLNKNSRWMFNISINITEEFMKSYNSGDLFELKDGTKVNPNDILNSISESAWGCGDPGIAFLERFDKDNPVPHLGNYKSLAPCGEVAMADGETCQFAYVNVGNFVQDSEIDYSSLEETLFDVVRFLDDALEISIENYGNPKSQEIMSQKRKIGVGLCGFADLLVKLNIPYDSDDAEAVAENVMSFVNLSTKKASVELAKTRDPFPSFYDSETRIGKGYLLNRYGSQTTEIVSNKDWVDLYEDVKRYGIRHVSTTALPPTGRSSLVIGASPSIEPYFSIDLNDEMYSDLKAKLDVIGWSESKSNDLISDFRINGFDCDKLPYLIQPIYQTCLDIPVKRHLNIVGCLQRYTDESISKTVNMPKDVLPSDIKPVYLEAYDLGLKGMTIYRDGSKEYQPKNIKK